MSEAIRIRLVGGPLDGESLSLPKQPGDLIAIAPSGKEPDPLLDSYRRSINSPWKFVHQP